LGAFFLLYSRSMPLDAEERRVLRREIDRRTRLKIGEPSPTGSWVSLSEASEIVGIKSSNLRRKLVALGAETKRSANRRLVPVEALDVLRDARWGD
jgi:hypothetical protein